MMEPVKGPAPAKDVATRRKIALAGLSIPNCGDEISKDSYCNGIAMRELPAALRLKFGGDR